MLRKVPIITKGKSKKASKVRQGKSSQPTIVIPTYTMGITYGTTTTRIASRARAHHHLHRPRQQESARPLVPFHVFSSPSSSSSSKSQTPYPSYPSYPVPDRRRCYVRSQPDLYRPGYYFLPRLSGRYRYISRQQVADYAISIPEQEFQHGEREEIHVSAAPAYPKPFLNLERFPFLDKRCDWLEYPFTLPQPYYEHQVMQAKATWDSDGLFVGGGGGGGLYKSPGPVRIVYREQDRSEFYLLFHDPAKWLGPVSGSGWRRRRRNCAFSAAVAYI